MYALIKKVADSMNNQIKNIGTKNMIDTVQFTVVSFNHKSKIITFYNSICVLIEVIKLYGIKYWLFYTCIPTNTKCYTISRQSGHFIVIFNVSQALSLLLPLSLKFFSANVLGIIKTYNWCFILNHAIACI